MPRLEGTLQAIQRWDERACARLNRVIRFRLLLHFFRAVSWLGDGIFWYALMLALLLANGTAGAFAPQVLAAAGVLKGRKCSAYTATAPDVTVAGGTWVDVGMDGAVVDGNLVTGPAWPALKAWLGKFLELLGTKIEA